VARFPIRPHAQPTRGNHAGQAGLRTSVRCRAAGRPRCASSSTRAFQLGEVASAPDGHSAPADQGQRRLRRAPASDREGLRCWAAVSVGGGVGSVGVCPRRALFERTRNLMGVQAAGGFRGWWGWSAPLAPPSEPWFGGPARRGQTPTSTGAVCASAHTGHDAPLAFTLPVDGSGRGVPGRAGLNFARRRPAFAVRGAVMSVQRPGRGSCASRVGAVPVPERERGALCRAGKSCGRVRVNFHPVEQDRHTIRVVLQQMRLRIPDSRDRHRRPVHRLRQPVRLLR
jgi:hypothetical protein